MSTVDLLSGKNAVHASQFVYSPEPVSFDNHFISKINLKQFAHAG